MAILKERSQKYAPVLRESSMRLSTLPGSYSWAVRDASHLPIFIFAYRALHKTGAFYSGEFSVEELVKNSS